MSKLYESGIPCKRGHPGLRYLSSNGCVDCVKERATRWANENKEKRKQIVNKWDRSNQSKRNEIEAKRRAASKSATPKWLTDSDKDAIQKIYEYARSLGYHVDHIVPLKNKQVCGLHVPWNLQVIPALDNIRKNNTFDIGD